jgi:predicted CXXCH cytochrome family protein
MRTTAKSKFPFLFSRLIGILFLLLFLTSTWSGRASAGHDRIECAVCHLRTEAQLNDYTYDPSDFPDSVLCLSCHDAGRDASGFNPPYVINGNQELAGGSFTPTLRSDKVGHNLITTDMTLGWTPPGGAPRKELGCKSCHDAHGNGNFRNLKKEINGRQTPVRADGDPNFKDNVYISGMNDFCGGCHEKFHIGFNAGDMHPVGIRISGASHTGIGRWFMLTNKVTQVEYPSGDPNNPGSARVFCLSCHRAHASPYRDSMRWDYSKTPQGCLECHSF